MTDSGTGVGDGGTATRASLLWGGGVAAAVCAAVALPLWFGRSAVDDPAAEAEAAYRELLQRIEAKEPEPAEPAEPAALPAPPTSARDLFSPVSKRRPDLAQPQARRKEAALPALSGILIDGPQRHAVLDGRILGVGERVGAFRIAAIEPDAVVLRDGSSTHRLTVGPGR
jgi:hypothetical protein